MKELKLYNSLTRQKEILKPITEGFIGMYVCGPTVYSDVHIGNCRTFVSFDIIYRFLLHLGYKVRYVRNITDVGHLLNDGEDRISKGARANDLEPMEVVQKYMNGFHEIMAVFNTLKPSIEPRATGHLLEQIEMIQEIEKNGFAYTINGSVYFDTKKFAEKHEYGKLSGRKMDELLNETRDNLKKQGEKKAATDFALWIKADPDHLMRWNSPWSVGFPGWHLECSVMSQKYLGTTFDIHGGGNDLKFPHHENEVAQSVGACGCGPVNYWLHTNMLLMNGKKMSKSDNNSITPIELFTGDSDHISQAYHPMALRFFMLQSHYSSTLDITDEALLAAEKGFTRLTEGRTRLMKLEGTGIQDSELDIQVRNILDAAMDEMCDDFNTPKALARIFELVPIINSLADGKISLDKISNDAMLQFQRRFDEFYLDIFGLHDPQVKDEGLYDKMDGVMQLVIEMRKEARENKNWATSDKIRDSLTAAGISLKDSKDKTDWSLN